VAPRRTAKARPENEETTNHSRTVSPKGRCRSLVCSQKTGRKGPDAVIITIIIIIIIMSIWKICYHANFLIVVWALRHFIAEYFTLFNIYIFV
jgi:hypothetical protein